MYQEQLTKNNQPEVFVNPVPPPPTPTERKPKVSILKFLAIGCFTIFILIGIIVVGFIAFIIWSIIPSETPSSKIESAGTIFVADNKLFINDYGYTISNPLGGSIQKTPKVVWVFGLPDGNFISQDKEGSDEYSKKRESIMSNRDRINRIESISLSQGSTNGAISSTTKKTYLISGRLVEKVGSQGYIDVYGPKDEKIREINIAPSLIFSDPSGYIYFITTEESGAFINKLDSKTDKVIKKVKFPINRSSLELYISGNAFVDDDELYTYIQLLPLDPAKTEIIIYNLEEDKFIYKFEFEGSYLSFFPYKEDFFLSGKSGVVWVDKKSGEIKKRFTGK